MNKAICLPVALALSVSGCTWVNLSESGTMVRLAAPEAVTSCKKLGNTLTTSTESIGIIERNDGKVATELLTLAKNSAAEMGGDTIVETGGMENGRQTFTVYACGTGDQ